jgi:ribonuclease HI
MDYDEIVIHTDGGSRGNPGPAAIGVTCDDQDQNLFEISEYIGETTNNVAEYTAVIKALEKVIDLKIKAQKVLFVLDSELIVKQLLGQYKIKDSKLKELNSQVQTLKSQLKTQGTEFRIKHVLRDENKMADKLVNAALDSLN